MLRSAFSRSLHSISPLRTTRIVGVRAFSSGGGIPVIDLKPFYSGTPEGKLKVAQQIGDACENIGFLTVTNHSVPKDLINRMNDVTKKYFDLPREVKEYGCEMTDTYPYGYNGFMEENLSKGLGDAAALPDLKECFAIGPNNPLSLMPAPRWPKQPKEMAEVWGEYYAAMETLSSQLLSCFALALQLPETFFDDKITYHRSVIRALNYPETNTEPAPGQCRAGAHTDYGSLTCLLQDEVGGLQVLDKQKVWQDVPYIEGSYVINIGDLMARWTNDKWVSTLHRVMPRQPRRQSIAFFHNINHDHIVETIDTCVSEENPSKYEPIAAWDHLIEKHNASVKY